MTPAVFGLLMGALLFGGLPAEGQTASSQVDGRATLTLTNDSPSGFFALGEKTLASAPPILALTITKVVNPAQTGLDISVYLSFQPPSSSAGAKEPGEKVLIGNFSLYPPDHPAGFLLRASEAFSKLRAAGAVSRLSPVQLLIEMKRIHEGTPWTPVELVIGPPEWRSEARK
jgi:hypothetical protein